jgi:hypothetical protein
MWPFSTKQERQAEAMSMILAENSYDRKMERMAGWVRTVVAMIGGVLLTFGILLGLDMLGHNPISVWEWVKSKF